MASFMSKRSNSHCHVRSVSLPARLHPSSVKTEQVLNKLKSWQASSTPMVGTVYNSLAGLTELYECIEELLQLPMTRQALSQEQNDACFNDIMEESVKYIDICSNTRETVNLFKEELHEIQSALRRSKVTDLSKEDVVTAYICCRKRIQKQIAKYTTVLKHIDNRLSSMPQFDSNYQLSAMIKVLREASHVTVNVIHSLLQFLSVPVLKSKPTRWSLVSKFVHKGVLQGSRMRTCHSCKLDK